MSAPEGSQISCESASATDYEAVTVGSGVSGPIIAEQLSAAGHLVRNGPVEIDSTDTQVLGGTARHRESKALRVLPDDVSLITADLRVARAPIMVRSGGGGA